MKQIKQFRYYHPTDSKNYPDMYNYYGKLISGNIFSNLGVITHLGIQGAPGTKFYLNGASFPITIGFTGIYELEFNGGGKIHSIKFDQTSLDTLYLASTENRLLIDVVYEGGAQG